MTGDSFKILTRTPVPKLPRVPPPPPPPPPRNHRGYKRVYKFKEQYMNKSTFCEIKYMNRLVFFSKAGYMIGVGFKILTRRPVSKFTRVPSPPSPELKLQLVALCLRKLCAIILFASMLQVVLIMLNG